MNKIYYFLFLLFFCATVNAQNILIKGNVIDSKTQLPLEMATVYFSDAKDSTVVEYASTDKNGAFKISTKKYNKPILLKVNFVGYKTYSEKQNGILTNQDFGKIILQPIDKMLDEVVVKNEAPPIKIKKDTIEYNAKSFKVRPDANVETLLKQLPGFEVDTEGKVTVNGKDVNQFLVNGKPFFDRDGAIALKNLPADIINKVQVSDFKTRKEEFAKQESTSDFSSVNMTIDENKNKGYFGKFLAGYGSDNRYEASMIMNYFKDKQKLSLLANSNNINSTGFTQDEVFDSMSGGRNSRVINRVNVGNKGITTSNLVGMNYADQWFKELDANASYNFSNTVNKNESQANQVNFLPTGTIFTKSNSTSTADNTGNKANFELEYKPTATIRILFAPKVEVSNAMNYSNSESFSTNDNLVSINENNAETRRESTADNLSNTITINKIFKKKDRNLSVVFNNSFSNENNDALTKSETIFLQGTRPDDIRNQTRNSANLNQSHSTEIEYTEPITDSLRVRIGSEFSFSNGFNDIETFDFDAVSQLYDNKNDLQTNYTSFVQNAISPKLGVVFEKNNFTFNIGSSTSLVRFDNYSLYLNKPFNLNQNYVLPSGRVQVRYRIDRLKSATFRFDFSNSVPGSTQLIPVENLANPLNTIIGNPDLKQNKKSGVNLNLRNFDIRSRSGYFLYVNADFFDSEIVSSTVFDSSGKRTTNYKNVSGTYTSSIGGSWNQTYKKEAHVFRYGFGIRGSYALDKGFTNAVLFEAKSLDMSPRLNFSYEYGELLTIAPSFFLTYNETKYFNSVLDATSNRVYGFNIQTTNYWPKNFIFGNDFNYNYNSNISDDFRKDFYLWNTSLSYLFLNKTMTFKVKVYDVLNQNLSAVRTITSTTIRDEENTVLKRYVMFSLAYKIGNFAPKERRSGRMRMRDMEGFE